MPSARRNRNLLAAALLLAVALAPAPAGAASTLTLQTMKPTVRYAAGGPEQTLAPAAFFDTGDSISVQVGPAGRARLSLDGASFILEAGSDVRASATALAVRRGETWCHFRRRGDTFRIVTPTAVLGIRGTAFRLSVAANGETAVDLFEGKLAVSTRSGETELLPGESLRVDASNRPPRKIAFSAAAAARFKTVSRQLDRNPDRLTVPETQPATARPVGSTTLRGVDLKHRGIPSNSK